MKHLFSILLLLSCLPFIHNQQAPEYQDVQIPFDQNIDLTQGASRYYAIDITNRRSVLDLALLALAFRGSSPKLYAGKTPDQLENPGSAPYASNDPNGEVVYISNQDLADQQKIYVKLVCEAPDCNFRVTFEYSTEIKMEANGFRVYESATALAGASIAIVRLKLPAIENVERIVIHAEAIPTKNQASIPQFDMMLEQGDKIPHTSRVMNIARTSWFEGKTVVIHKDHPLFCPTCNYTLNLKLSEGIAVSIEANAFASNTNLTGHPILDGVERQTINTYTFNFRDPEEEFVIDIRPQQGRLTLHLDCGANLPNDILLYYWSYNITESEEIVLTPREHAKCQLSPYRIVAFGDEDAVYSIRAFARYAGNLQLEKESRTVGDLFPGESISYEFFMPIFSVHQIMIDIEYQAVLDLNITNCKFPGECPGLLPAQTQAVLDVENPYERNETEFDYTNEEIGNLKRRIIIDPHTTGCYPIYIQDRRFMEDPIPVCAYQLTLHSNQPRPVEYTIKTNPYGHEWMYPGVSKLGAVEKSGFKYYMLYVPHKDVGKVVIQVTKFSGDVEVFVSKTVKQPNVTTDDTVFSHEGMIVFTNETATNGTYYIAVEGIQPSSFSIAAFIEGKDGVLQDYALTLEEGVPQKGVLLPKHEHPVQYYKLILDLADDWEGSLRIGVRPDRGDVIMVVNNNDVIPLPGVSTWKTTNHDLEIKSDHHNFKRNGTYHIGIYMEWENQRPYGWDDLTFTIVYHVQEKGKDGEKVVNLDHLMLSELMPYYGSIRAGEVKYFEVSASKTDSTVTIFKQADAGGVDLFVSLDPDNEYPDESNYNLTTKFSHTDSLELNYTEVRKICGEDYVKVVCTFYLSVVPSSDQRHTNFHLLLKRNFRGSDFSTITPLEEGKQLISDTPGDDNAAQFYFYPHSTDYSIITVTCPGKQIDIYAKIKPITIGQSRHASADIDLPDTESYDYSSYGNSTIGLTHLAIPPSSEGNSTIVSLSVYFKSISNTDSPFTIVVSSQVRHIYVGHQYFGSVPNDTYVYFYFNVYKENCTLLFTLTSLDDGDPDLLVSTGENLRPTLADAEFTSISEQRAELIEIGNNDIYPVESMAGVWTVGVYGRTASAFSLTVLYEDQKTVDLKSGIPFEMFLKEDSVMYFRFYHELANDIEVKLDRFSGDVNAYIVNIPQKEDSLANLPSEANYTWKIQTDYETVVRINTTDEKACTNCLYLVAVKTRSASKFVITVVEDVKFIKIQNGLHYADGVAAKSFKSYAFASPNSDEVYLDLHIVGTGLKVYTSQNPTVNNSNYDTVESLSFNEPNKHITLKKSDYHSEVIWDGTKEFMSERNSFYLVFENPTPDQVNYTFVMRTKDSNIILRPGARQHYFLGSKNQTSWLFYSSHDNETIKIIIEFQVQKNNNSETSLQKYLEDGLPIQGRYWIDQQNQGEGEEIGIVRSKVMNDQVSFGNLHNYRQVISTSSKKGKFLFDLENPFEQQIAIGVRLFRSEAGSFTLDQNSEHNSILHAGHSENIEIYLAHKGAWYLWVYTCSGEVEVSVQDSSKELELASSIEKIPQGQSYMFREYRPSGGVKVVNIARSAHMNQDTQFYLSTSHFNEEKVYDFEPENEHPKVQYHYTFDPAGTNIFLTLPTIVFDEIDPTDYVVYYVRLCPHTSNEDEDKRNICVSDPRCRLFNKKVPLDAEFQVRFDNIGEGSFYINAIANIYHMDKLVRFVPYPVRNLEVGPQSVNFEEGEGNSTFGYVLLGLIVVILLGGLGYFGYNKLKSFIPKSGLEMQNFPQKQKYEGVVDEEDQSLEGTKEAEPVEEISVEKS